MVTVRCGTSITVGAYRQRRGNGNGNRDARARPLSILDFRFSIPSQQHQPGWKPCPARVRNTVRGRPSWKVVLNASRWRIRHSCAG